MHDITHKVRIWKESTHSRARGGCLRAPGRGSLEGVSVEGRYCPVCGDRIEAERCPVHDEPVVTRPTLQAPPELAAGMLVGDRYRVDHLLAETSFSALLLATDLLEKRTVMLKTLPGEDLARRAIVLGRLLLESRVVALFDRTDLVRILDFGVEASTQLAFLVLEYHAGRPISDAIAPGSPETRTAAAFVEVAEALLESHDRVIREASGVMVAPTPGPRTPSPRIPAARTPHPRMAPPRASSLPRAASAVPGPVVEAEEVPTVRAIPIRSGPRRISEPGDVEGATSRLRSRNGRRAPARRSNRVATGLALAVFGALCLYTLLFVEDFSDSRPDSRALVFLEDPRQGARVQSAPEGFLTAPAGIAELGASPTGRLTVVSEPRDAIVFDGSRRLGVTPVRVERPRAGTRLLLRVSKAGYVDETVEIEADSAAGVTVKLARTDRTPPRTGPKLGPNQPSLAPKLSDFE